jgi:MYXO-CTERM domain-containing protein
MPGRNLWVRRVASLAALFTILALSTVALAAGRVQWKSTTFKETESKAWKLEVKIFLARAPDTAHIPVKFEFAPTAYYERAMLDGDKLVERTVPLVGRQDIIEGVDIGFMDPGSGKIEKGTRFSFKITRAHGVEAGEYKVTVRDARNGQVIGTPVTLKLDGENEIIDRRAMVFADPKDKKKKKKKDEGGEKKDEGGEKKDEGGEKKDESVEGPAPEESPAETPPASEEKPGEVKEKPGGCGCRVADTRGSSPTAALAGLLGLSLLLGRRARR